MQIFYAYMTLEHYTPSKINVNRIRKKSLRYLKNSKHEVIVYGNHVDDHWNDKFSNGGTLDILNALKNTDVFIGEMTAPSQTIGFLLGYAIQHGKPSLFFYPEDTPRAKPAGPIFFNPSRLLAVKSFNDTNYELVLTSFLRKARKQLRSDRTTFVSTRYINDYLKWKSYTTGLSKGEILRGILECGVNTDPDYKDK